MTLSLSFPAGPVFSMRRGGINFAARRPRPTCRRSWWRRCWQPLNNNNNNINNNNHINNNNDNKYKTTTITLITTIKQQQQQVTSCVKSFSCTTRMLSSYWRSSPIHFHHLCLNKKVLTPVDLSLFLFLFGWIYFPEISNLTHHLIVHVFCLSLRQAYWLFFSFNRFI